jgi:O-antigen ligase
MSSSKLFTGIEKAFFYLLILFIPTQLGKHFWPDFSIVSGIRVDYLSPTLYLTDTLIFLLFMFWVINRFQKTRKTQRNRNIRLSENLKVRTSSSPSILSVQKIYLLFIALLFFNVIFSHNILNSFYHLLKLCEFMFIGFYIAARIKTLEKIRKTFLFLAIAAIFESLLAIAQFVNQGSLGGLFYFLGERMFNSSTPGIANASINGELLLRPYGTFPHPNVLAGFLVCLMGFVLFSLSFNRRGLPLASPLRLIWILSLLLGTSALILTMSRVAVVLWIMVLVLLLSKTRLQINKYAIIFGFLFLLGISLFSPFGSRIIATSLTEEAVVQRQELITSSFKLFAKQPMLGIGLGNFIPSLANVQKPLSPGLYLQPVHNIFLLVLAETGIVGFGFFVWFLIKTYRYLLSNLKTHAVFLILLTSVLVLGLFDHYFLTLQQGQLLFAIILGLCWTKFGPRT